MCSASANLTSFLQSKQTHVCHSLNNPRIVVALRKMWCAYAIARGLYKAKQFEPSSSLPSQLEFARSLCYTSTPGARARAHASSSSNSAVTVKFSAVAPSSSSHSPSQSLNSSPQQRAVRDVNHGISFSSVRRLCPPLCHLGKCVSPGVGVAVACFVRMACSLVRS